MSDDIGYKGTGALYVLVWCTYTLKSDAGGNKSNIPIHTEARVNGRVRGEHIYGVFLFNLPTTQA